MPTFLKYTDMSSLIPYLYRHRLITCEEHEEIERLGKRKGATHYYTGVLQTKGTKAHLIFYQCLREAVEELDCHLGHRELLKLF